MNEYEMFRRWIDTLRHKAREYEHAARHAGKQVTAPDLDAICNEMEAFLAGRGSQLPGRIRRGPPKDTGDHPGMP